MKKLAVGAGVVAVVIGSASVALAADSSASASGSSISAAKAGPHTAKGHHHRDALRRAAHAQWVTVNKSGAAVTHDAVRGVVSSVSPTSITVTAKDSTQETYAVSGTVRVRLRAPGHSAAKTSAGLGQVKVGDRVAVIGTGTSSLIATRVVDRGANPPATSGSKGAGKQPAATSSASPS